MGKNGGGLPGRCLSVGKTIASIQCGFAYAGNAIMKGDGTGVLMGLDTVGEMVRQAESLMPKNKRLLQSIKTDVLKIAKALKPGTKVSKTKAGEILTTVRKLSQQANQLYVEGAKGCV